MVQEVWSPLQGPSRVPRIAQWLILWGEQEYGVDFFSVQR